MKFVREESRPISADTGLLDIKALAERDDFQPAARPGQRYQLDTSRAYVDHLLSYVDVGALKPLKIVVDAGNGGAGRVIDLLEPLLPFEFIKLHHEPDGNFPNGVPNPLLPENRSAASEAVRRNGADLGIAWDGDFDRCFFFDETGEFVEGYYLVGLLAAAFLKRDPAVRIVHDPRLTWNTREVVQALGGEPVQSKCGHAFIKERMRSENAVYGGEMSAHHYFRDFAYCDSGMIPWLLVAGLLSDSGQPLSALVAERVAAYPCSGEINRTIDDPAAVLGRVRETYEAQSIETESVDGLSMDMGDWRFNLRMSNTEPVVRLNVESRGDAALMEAKTAEILALVEQQG
jgi:phosphomannomutase